MNWLKAIKSDFVSLFFSSFDNRNTSPVKSNFYENDYAAIMVKLKSNTDEIFSG